MTMTDWFPTCDVMTARDKEKLDKLANWFDTTFEPIEGKDATMWFMENDGDTPVAVVYVREEVKGIQLYAIIAHEATHCAMDYMESIGEEEFSSEFVAYTVQSFASEIMQKMGVE